MINLKKEEINKDLQNAEEYRKMTFNVFVPLIEKSIKEGKTEIYLKYKISNSMKTFLENKEFECKIGQHAYYSLIRW
jgi:hypothetical protein